MHDVGLTDMREQHPFIGYNLGWLEETLKGFWSASFLGSRYPSLSYMIRPNLDTVLADAREIDLE
jgi:hypothetical protein